MECEMEKLMDNHCYGDLCPAACCCEKGDDWSCDTCPYAILQWLYMEQGEKARILMNCCSGIAVGELPLNDGTPAGMAYGQCMWNCRKAVAKATGQTIKEINQKLIDSGTERPDLMERLGALSHLGGE